MYTLHVNINGYWRLVGRPMDQEQALAAIDQLGGKYQLEIRELIPPTEQPRYTRTTAPSRGSDREFKREWRRVGLTKCLNCRQVNNVWENYNTHQRKCQSCGKVGPETKFMPWLANKREMD